MRVSRLPDKSLSRHFLPLGFHIPNVIIVTLM
jgi:hypothetical protein